MVMMGTDLIRIIKKSFRIINRITTTPQDAIATALKTNGHQAARITISPAVTLATSFDQVAIFNGGHQKFLL